MKYLGMNLHAETCNFEVKKIDLPCTLSPFGGVHYFLFLFLKPI